MKFLLCLSCLLLNILPYIQSVSVGILVHGYNCGAEGWDKVVLGDIEHGKLGRSSHAIAIASRYLSMKNTCVKCIFWGSGVPGLCGLREGEYTLSTQLSKFSDLASFPEFSHISEESMQTLHDQIKQISITDSSSINTVTEIENAFELFKSLNIDHVILISSATHIPRCIRDASNILESPDNLDWRPMLLASPAPVCFVNSKVSDVVIFEPPHLPTEKLNENPALRLHLLGKRCLQINSERKPFFLKDMDELLQIYDV
eukprot:gene7879-16127_t